MIHQRSRPHRIRRRIALGRAARSRPPDLVLPVRRERCRTRPRRQALRLQRRDPRREYLRQRRLSQLHPSHRPKTFCRSKVLPVATTFRAAELLPRACAGLVSSCQGRSLHSLRCHRSCWKPPHAPEPLPPSDRLLDQEFHLPRRITP